MCIRDRYSEATANVGASVGQTTPHASSFMSSLGLGHAIGVPAPDYFTWSLLPPTTQTRDMSGVEVPQVTLGPTTTHHHQPAASPKHSDPSIVYTQYVNGLKGHKVAITIAQCGKDFDLGLCFTTCQNRAHQLYKNVSIDFCFRWKTVSLVHPSMQHLMHHVTVSLQQSKITLQNNCINNTSITQPTLSFYLWLKM